MKCWLNPLDKTLLVLRGSSGACGYGRQQHDPAVCRTNCKSKRSMYLLTIVSKFLACLILRGAQKLCVLYLDHKCGFRSGQFAFVMITFSRQCERNTEIRGNFLHRFHWLYEGLPPFKPWRLLTS